MTEVFIVGGVRTPIGKTNGILRDFLPEELTTPLLRNILSRYGLEAGQVEHVVLGNATGPGGNIARVAVLQAGWPYDIPAMTVDTQCASGITAINMAANMIAAGQAELVVAGGVESTSMAPRRQFNPHDPRFQGADVFYEQAPFSPPQVGNPEVGAAAEQLAQKLDISREAMDAWAVGSHQKAAMTRAKQLLRDIIVPVGKQGMNIAADECIRAKITLKLLERMPPAFAVGGRVTAGNTCLKHDGAAVVLLASAAAIKKWHLPRAARLIDTVTAGCDPNIFPLGPVAAIRKLLAKNQLSLEQIAAVEINEAFAVKILACCRELGLAAEKVNPLGGALAYGHPYGASGAIILLHLLKYLEERQEKFGIAAIGAVGGIAAASLIERLS